MAYSVTDIVFNPKPISNGQSFKAGAKISSSEFQSLNQVNCLFTIDVCTVFAYKCLTIVAIDPLNDQN